MNEAIYTWVMRVMVSCYAVGGLCGLLAHDWKRATIALLLGVVNYLIFF